MELAGKVAVVTGSSSGVGEATAELLASLGVKVVVNYVSGEAAAADIVARIEANGGTAHAVKADVRNDSECRALIAAAVATYGGIDILVNNAGMTHFIDHADLEAVTDESGTILSEQICEESSTAPEPQHHICERLVRVL